VTVVLDEQERSWLAGVHGAAMQLAMRLVAAAAEATGATSFVPIEMAHINSCHYSGRLSLDFAEFLLAEGATLAVPTHTNASLISCSSPDLRPESEKPEAVAGALRVMQIYEELGCSSMWTCAPYQQPEGRPTFGQQIVGSESNAVGFFNSVLGARTNKYGDLLDISAAMVGRVPLTGLHTDEGRRATHLFDLQRLSDGALTDPNLPHLLGTVIGREVSSGVAVIVGLESLTEDELKAIAAGAAASGGVDMFHVVGVTPEASTLDAATQGEACGHTTIVNDASLNVATSILNSANGDERLRAVCLGTPHFSIDEFLQTVAFLDGRRVDDRITMLITTSRSVAIELDLRGLSDVLADAGVSVVLDTCTYYPPRPTGIDGLTMTNSAKWAYYAQGMLDVPVAFDDLEKCVESAVQGRRVR
jgi:predicted aconitase